MPLPNPCLALKYAKYSVTTTCLIVLINYNATLKLSKEMRKVDKFDYVDETLKRPKITHLDSPGLARKIDRCQINEKWDANKIVITKSIHIQWEEAPLPL